MRTLFYNNIFFLLTGMKKGDRVAIYMPMILELVVAMLACVRIGLVHSIVIYFSTLLDKKGLKSLAERILDAKSTLLITADGGYRGQKLVNLKSIAEKAIDICNKNVYTCERSGVTYTPASRGVQDSRRGQSLMLCGFAVPCKIRLGTQNLTLCRRRGVIFSVTPQDNWNVGGIVSFWHEEIKGKPNKCDPEWMDAEDPLFILYTRYISALTMDKIRTISSFTQLDYLERLEWRTERKGRRKEISVVVKTISTTIYFMHFFIVLNSGSTGKPKGILHTTAGYMIYAYTTFKYVFDYHENDVYFCTADIGWITGHTYVSYGPLLNAATSIMFEGIPFYPDASRFWNIIDKYKVSIFYTAPTAIRALMRFSDDYVKKTSRESLRLLGSVGEPINPEAWLWYHRVVGNSQCPIVDTFWQTETVWINFRIINGFSTLKTIILILKVITIILRNMKLKIFHS
ncbi:UNVERIFIED_CONTAM: acsA [Trichonephila clavipes]